MQLRRERKERIYVFRGQVCVDDTTGQESGQREAVTDALEEHTGGSERGRGDVLTRLEVDRDADREVERRDETLAEEDRLLVVALVPHLGRDGKAKVRRERVSHDL